ncbi:hypothetical protein SALBM311S_12019 [Streptomyces alboniger]
MLGVVTDVAIAEIQAQQVAVRGFIKVPSVAAGALWIVLARAFAAFRSVPMLPVADGAERHVQVPCDLGVFRAAAQEGEGLLAHLSAMKVHIATLRHWS